MAIRTRESSEFCDTHGGRSGGRNLQFGSSPTHRFNPMIGYVVPAGAAIQSRDFHCSYCAVRVSAPGAAKPSEGPWLRLLGQLVLLDRKGLKDCATFTFQAGNGAMLDWRNFWS